MKDKRVINIISNTYVAMVSFLSFIFISLIAIFIILQNGLYLDNLSISNITVKNLYIKWNEKLNISVEEIDITPEESSQKEVDLDDLSRYLKLVSRLFLLTESVVIEKLQYKDMILRLNHNNKERGFLVAKSPSLHFDSHFKFQNELLVFTIDKFLADKNTIDIRGKIFLNLYKKNIFSKLHIEVNSDDADFTLYTMANEKRLKYKIQSNKKIEHLHELVSLFPLPKAIHFWTIDAIDAKSLTIEKMQGFVEFNNIASAYKNIYVKATLNKLNYTYNTKLDAIHTQTTELEFSNGILFIRPKEAYSYGMYLDRSWLKIDFTKKEELLTLYLLFKDGMLNKDMLHILSTYNINLPFLQHSGKIDTNLKLVVGLRTIAIDARGEFYTKKANFDYLGLNIDIADTLIKLYNYDVNITKMHAQYKDIAEANVTVQYNAKKAKGDINFSFNKIKLANNASLDAKKEALHAIYRISPDGDKILAKKSHWNVSSFAITLDALELPFNLNTLDLSIPTTYFTIHNFADGFVTGKANIKNMLADLKVDLLNFQYQGVKLAKSNTELSLHYKDKLFIKSDSDILLSVNGSPYSFKNLSLIIDNNKVSIADTKVEISDYIKTKISASYAFQDKKANIQLSNFILINPKNQKIIYYKNHTMLSLKVYDKSIKINSKELNAYFSVNKDQWLLHLNDIGIISKNSNFLKKYDLTNGQISFYKNSNDKYTKFKGTINYKYKLLTNREKAVTSYKIKGYITKSQKLYMSINDKVNIKVADEIKINLKNSGINVEELLNFVNLLMNINKKAKLQENVNAMNIFFKAQNSYLYVGNDRYIISDTMNLQYYNNIITAQLQYKQGKAGFKLNNNSFHLYGQDFNDKFMEKLFSLSKFNGGSLDFSMSGTFKDYSGTFYIKDTTIQDYVVLNNILAFINTVPSLATFSLPGYNKKGLHIDNAYMKFHSKDHIFHISDIYIGSKEIKIFGKGTASVKYDNIDLALNLKTDLASNLSKIPVVGYIIFDGQSISTTLKITGKLTDPKVTTMIARDIAVAPLNIIMRTLTLPYKFVKDISDYNSSKEK